MWIQKWDFFCKYKMASRKLVIGEWLKDCFEAYPNWNEDARHLRVYPLDTLEKGGDGK